MIQLAISGYTYTPELVEVDLSVTTPCKVGQISEKFYVFRPTRGILLIGPISSITKTILPLKVQMHIDILTQSDLEVSFYGAEVQDSEFKNIQNTGQLLNAIKYRNRKDSSSNRSQTR